MAELPQPDLLDSSGRMRRLVVALLAGGAAAALAYFIANAVAKPDEMAASGQHTRGSVGRAFGFVFYMTAFAGAAVFTIVLVVQNQLAKKKWRRELVPPAQVRS